jgi:hypothetical protein
MIKRKLMALAGGLLLVQGGAAIGDTRIASVYIESMGALQSQILQAAQLFEAPELGTVPMMMGMGIPGFMQIDRSAPVAMHVFKAADSKMGFVLSVKPVGTPELLLEAIMASQGGTLPEAVDGRFITVQGAAQMHEGKLLIGRNVQDLDLALSTGLPHSMPGVSGLIRLDIEPARLAPILEQLQALALDAMPATGTDADMRALMTQALSFYRSGLEQVASFHHGIGLGAQGIEIRTRIVPAKGRAFEGIVNSLQGVDRSWLASLGGGNMFGMVSGAYNVPPELATSLLDAYITMMAKMPDGFVLDPAFMREVMQPSLDTMGAPVFVFADPSADGGGFSLFGGMEVADGPGLLGRMLALMSTEAYQAQMKTSGMKVTEPVTRTVADTTVYRWSMAFDDEAFLEKMQEAGAQDVDPAELATIKQTIGMFLSGYDYAATGKGLVFGIREDADIQQAMALLAAKGSDAGADAILARIGAPVLPYMVSRLDLLAWMQFMQKLGTPALPVVAGKGEGVLMAGWRVDGALEHVVLVPARDVIAIRKATAQMQESAEW